MTSELISKAYAIAKERYAEIGVDTVFRTSTSPCTAGRPTTYTASKCWPAT